MMILTAHSQAQFHPDDQFLIRQESSKVSHVKSRNFNKIGLTADLLRKYKHMESMIQFYDQVRGSQLTRIFIKASRV